MTQENPKIPVEIPTPLIDPDTSKPVVPEEIEIPEDDPDMIPDTEDPFETPPPELPEPAEGP